MNGEPKHNEERFKRRWSRLWRQEWRDTATSNAASKQMQKVWKAREQEPDYSVLLLVCTAVVVIAALLVSSL